MGRRMVGWMVGWMDGWMKCQGCGETLMSYPCRLLVNYGGLSDGLPG